MDKRIISIDFDGTIVNDCYPKIGATQYGVKEAINEIYYNPGNYVIINTCRQGKELIDCVNFLIEHGIHFHRINDNAPWLNEKYGHTRKIFAHIYIDSSNIGGIPPWKEIPNMIEFPF